MNKQLSPEAKLGRCSIYFYNFLITRYAYFLKSQSIKSISCSEVVCLCPLESISGCRDKIICLRQNKNIFSVTKTIQYQKHIHQLQMRRKINFALIILKNWRIALWELSREFRILRIIDRFSNTTLAPFQTFQFKIWWI